MRLLPITRSITWRYATGLLLVAAVIIGSYVLQTHTLKSKGKSAHIINISGMQRMLSQRIALMAREVHHATSASDASLYAQKMEQVTTRMRDNHNVISDYLTLFDGSTANGAALLELHTLDGGINQRVTRYLGFADDFLAHYKTGGVDAVRASTLTHDIVTIARNGLLAQLNEAVSHFETQALDDIETMRQLEKTLLAIGLSLLVLEALFIFRPITRHVARYASNLEQSNAELTEFSYRVSHDLRAPIVSSRGLVHVIETLVESGEKEQTTTALALVHGSLVKLETLIDDIINMTRMKLEEEEKEAVDLNILINESTNALSQLAAEHNVRIHVDISGNPHIHVKRLHLQQVIDNLLSNGIKYHDAQETSSYVELTATVDNGTCTLHICDNGIGIPTKYHDQLFSMFKRFHPKHSFGSGLGLYLVKQNVNALHGTINYLSREKGSQFTVTLPV